MCPLIIIGNHGERRDLIHQIKNVIITIAVLHGGNTFLKYFATFFATSNFNIPLALLTREWFCGTCVFSKKNSRWAVGIVWYGYHGKEDALLSKLTFRIWNKLMSVKNSRNGQNRRLFRNSMWHNWPLVLRRILYVSLIISKVHCPVWIDRG